MHSVKEFLDRHLKGDPYIWTVVLLMAAFSLIVVYSATGTLAQKTSGGNTERFLLSHGQNVVLGLIAMYFVHRMPYQLLKGLAIPLYLLSIGLLIYVTLKGSTVNEASRWVTLPGLGQSFQPSDLAKLAVILLLAKRLALNQLKVKESGALSMALVIKAGIVVGLIAFANISTGLILMSSALLLMVIGRVPILRLAAYTFFFVGCIGVAYLFGQRGETAMNRLSNAYGTEEVSFQRHHSNVAIASGGVFGKGPGNSEQRNILPHPYSDFIYSLIIEEYGLIGGIGVLVGYLVLLYRATRVVAASTKPFGGLVAAGLSFSLIIQAMVNMLVAVGVVPITGQPLPLLSMGGTSYIFTCISIGVILSVSRQDHMETEKQRMSVEPTSFGNRKRTALAS